MVLMDEEYQTRSVPIPVNRLGYFKRNWMQIYTPLVELFDIQVRFDTRTNSFDMRTKVPTNLEKCVQFVTAILHNFTIPDAMLVLKRKDVFIDTFRISDVKRLKNDHVGRAIGRIVGREGKIKKAIEAASGTRLAINDEEISILGNVGDISLARNAVCRLIMGSEPSKVCNAIRNIANKIKDRNGIVEVIKNRIE